MTAGFKKCPYCGKKIKDIAIKCQYCFKFLNQEAEKATKECPFCLNEIDINESKCPYCDEMLDVKNNSDIEKKSAVEKGFFYRFFRKDLALNKKWWHRLLKIIFFIVIVFIPLKSTYNEMIESSNFYWMEYVDSIANRVGDNIVRIGDLLNNGEHIDESSFAKIGEITLNHIDYSDSNRFEKTLESLYCSKQRNLNKLNAVIESTNLSFLNSFREPISLDQVLSEIKDYNCICIDSLGGGSVKFLNHTLSKLDDLYILKRTSKAKWYAFRFWFGKCYLVSQILILIPGLLVIVIYYKIIMYIIYGRIKSLNDEELHND